jgi:hypothetical protein
VRNNVRSKTVHTMRADYREWRTVRQVQKSRSNSAAPFLSPSRPRRLLLGIPSGPSSQSSGPPPATHSSRGLISSCRSTARELNAGSITSRDRVQKLKSAGKSAQEAVAEKAIRRSRPRLEQRHHQLRPVGPNRLSNALSLRPYGQEERANNNGVAMTTFFQGVARWHSKR